jgi:4-amino-4-deoxy-L-arabinose transferase-like glycosyltransferase
MYSMNCTKGRDWYGPYSRTLLLVCVATGLMCRLAVAIHVGLAMPPVAGSDAVAYDSYAWNLAQGHGYRGISPDVRGLDGQLLDHPTANFPPGTSVFWAVLYRIFGHRYDAVRIAQCVLGTLTILLIYAIGCHCFDCAVALLATAIYVLWPTALIYCTELGSEPLYTFLFCWFIFAALKFGEHPKWLNAIAAGLLLGLAMLTRSNGVLMVMLVIPWAFWEFRRTPRFLVRGLAVSLIAIAALVPWTVRNYRVFHSFIPFQTGGGDVLLGSNNRIVAGDPLYYGYWVYPTSELPEYRDQITAPNNEVARDHVEIQLALQWLRDHPEKWWYLAEMRFFRSWTPFLEARSPRLSRLGMLVSWGPVLVMFVFAFFPTALNFLRDNHPGWIIHLGVTHFVLTALIFWGASRFRYPVEGLCIILASAAVVWISRRVSGSNRMRSGVFRSSLSPS